nr:NADH-plastoquinone oxidoreductase subunit 7 [Dryopteris crassirhizoma]
MVRIDEMKESRNIIQQALKLLPGGPRGPGNRSMRLGCEIASFQLDRGIVSWVILIYTGLRTKLRKVVWTNLVNAGTLLADLSSVVDSIVAELYQCRSPGVTRSSPEISD